LLLVFAVWGFTAGTSAYILSRTWAASVLSMPLCPSDVPVLSIVFPTLPDEEPLVAPPPRPTYSMG
jgi:hypothetical protein